MSHDVHIIISILLLILDKIFINNISWPADSGRFRSPSFCHSTASAAIRWISSGLTHMSMFSGFMSVWIIRHFECRYWRPCSV